MQWKSRKASMSAGSPGPADTDGLADQATAGHVQQQQQQPVKRRGLSRLLACCTKPAVKEADRLSVCSSECCVTSEICPGSSGTLLGLGADSKARGAAAGKARREMQIHVHPSSTPEISSSSLCTPPCSPASPRRHGAAPPTAMSLDRPYSDAEWYAMVAFLRDLPSSSSSSTPAFRDCFWDARSMFSSISSTAGSDGGEVEVEALSPRSAAAAVRQAAWESIPRSLVPKGAAAPWVPQPALTFADPSWEYRPVDARAFYGYWARDNVRCTPAPFPTDLAMGFSALSCKIHESIPGLELRESADRRRIEMVALPTWLPSALAAVSYLEAYPLDSEVGAWAMRRDIPALGRTRGQVFMTTDNILVFRIWSIGLFSSKTEWMAEDFMRLEEGGRTMVAQMAARCCKTGVSAHMYQVVHRT